MNKPKICLISCPGGHFTELKAALSDINENEYNFYWISFKSENLMSFYSSRRHYYIKNINPYDKKTWIINAIQSLYILLKERPDCIITTGSGIAAASVFFAKKLLKRTKVLYITISAEVTEPSRTASFIYKYSDVFCTQWREQLKFFPNAKYIGLL